MSFSGFRVRERRSSGLAFAELGGIHLPGLQAENWQNGVIVGPRLPSAFSTDLDSPFFSLRRTSLPPSWPGWTNRLPSAPMGQPGGGCGGRGSS
jgi:hypothetical protein